MTGSQTTGWSTHHDMTRAIDDSSEKSICRKVGDEERWNLMYLKVTRFEGPSPRLHPSSRPNDLTHATFSPSLRAFVSRVHPRNKPVHPVLFLAYSAATKLSGLHIDMELDQQEAKEAQSSGL
jgi:hypothetical protein